MINGDVVQLGVNVLIGYLGATGNIRISSRIDLIGVVKNKEDMSVG
jgi:hypothetical protein